MKVPMVDLVAQHRSLQLEVDNAVSKVIQNGQFIGGREVELLESEIAEYCGTRYAVAVASGTDALKLSLIACGVSSGDEVITTPFTFIATAESISQCGATPIFSDIEAKTYNIDPSCIESKITIRTKAILPVHLYGQPADMDAILDIARRNKLVVIVDCAQALGAKYKGASVGGLGDASCLSFFPGKTLGAYGDGGMVVTNDLTIAGRVRILRNHGSKDKYHCLVHGFNSRLDTIQAAVLQVKLRYLDEWITARNDRSLAYNEPLSGLDGITVPTMGPHVVSAFNYYTIRVNGKNNRDNLSGFLKAKNIDSTVYYPLALHLQEVYKTLGYKVGDFPQSEQAQDEVLSLPIYPELTTHQIEWVVDQIREFAQ